MATAETPQRPDGLSPAPGPPADPPAPARAGRAESTGARNQPPALAGHDLFATDAVLAEALEREGAGWARDRASEVGTWAGTARAQELGTLANRHTPVLRTHDRFGNRIDEVEFHPAYHELLGRAVGFGLHSLPWRDPRPGAHVARAAMFFCFSQAEAGVGCPISMTYSAIPTLRREPELATTWEPALTCDDYDAEAAAHVRPLAEKPGALCGMGMTEKQGGSDVRANLTRATPLGDGSATEYAVDGHKWFMSAPMCDAFLILAQAPGGITCLLLPRMTPAGERNGLRLQRLKDKLGNRSNASSEVEFESAWARRIGEEGRGVQTILEMVAHTRLDCVIGSAAGIRAATAAAIHHARHRSAFGRLLAEQPLMTNVLADLAIESEAATLAAMRLARAFDEAARGDAEAERFRRIATPVLKYWICKRATPHTAEALECLGGNGYVEDSGLPRLLRESPLNSIWEGSGSIQALDVLRAAGRSPEALSSFLAELELARGADPNLDSALDHLRAELADPAEPQLRARRLVESMALCLQGSLLVRIGDPLSAAAFCVSRLGEPGFKGFGALPRGLDLKRIVSRHAPG